MKTQQEQKAFLIKANMMYRIGRPILSDLEFDALLYAYKTHYPQDNIEQIMRVCERGQKDREEVLPTPMFSLDKLKHEDEIQSWAIRMANRLNIHSQDLEIIITPKYDGISMCRDEGTTISWLRGDGEIGQRVDGFVTFVPVGGSIGIGKISAGELIMKKSSFSKYSEVFANPRNLVAGAFNRKSPEPEALSDVEYVRYGLFPITMNKDVELKVLNAANKVPVPSVKMVASKLCTGTLNNLFKDWSKEFTIDGLVLEVNDFEYRNRLGRETNGNPVYSRAVKLPQWQQGAESVVISITTEVSKQGLIKPVINIEPVEVGGVVISNVTGYNMAYVCENNICPGARISIIRSGDVIPKHIGTVSYSEKNLSEYMGSKAFQNCPSCGEQVYWDDNQVEKVCINSNCIGKKIKKIIHYFETLGSDGVGEKTIQSIVKGTKGDSLASIYLLTKADILELEGFAERSAELLLAEIRRVHTQGVSLARFLHALDIFKGRIGEKTLQKIIDSDLILFDDNFPELGKLRLNPRIENFYNHLISIDGVSEITANIFLNGMPDVNCNGALYILENINISKVKSTQSEGVRVCFTGVRPSSEVRQKMVKAGFQECDSVSKNTQMLVVKDLNSNSSKMAKAKGLSIEILSLEQFISEKLV